MAVQIAATGAEQLGQGVWSFEMPPHHVRHFGHTTHAVGASSVLVLSALEFDPEKQQLLFGLDHATLINVGTTSRVIAIAADFRAKASQSSTGLPTEPPALGPGDRGFLRLAKAELSTGTAEAAEALLHGVRERSPGDLKRGQTRNFSETPDNFWYVIVQPRVDELSVTVRGSVEHFQSIAKLEIKDDRGNTRFKVRSRADVPRALNLIFHALRKS